MVAAAAGSALVVPVDPRAAEPAEVLPQESAPKVAPVRKAKPSRKLRPGDLVCAECGEGNGPTRKFCLRCGEALTTAERVKTPWWRRIRRRGPRVVAAGKRPTRATAGRSRQTAHTLRRRARALVAVVVLGFGLLAGFYPPLRTWVDSTVAQVRGKVDGALSQTFDPVRPIAVTASAQSPDHPASAVFDRFSNTYWLAPWSSTRQPVLTVELGESSALVKVVVTSGAADRFAERHRPSIVNLAYSNEKSDTVTLKDSPEPQELTLRNGLGAKSVRIQVLTVYEAQGAGEVAVAEMEFFSAI